LPVKKKDDALALLAAALFTPLFIFRRVGPLDFWWWMAAGVALLGGLSLVLDKPYVRILLDDGRSAPFKKMTLGTLSSILLYAIFYSVDWLSHLFSPLAARQIGLVYSFKATAPALRLILLLLFLIGPGEEVFWRGFLQRHWVKKWGFPRGWLLATALYAAVHIGSGNLMLVLAALAGGLFWGYLYYRLGSVLLVAVSHTLWDILIFIIFPLA
jgi:membrane protease YdiL (CAAX protease family)